MNVFDARVEAGPCFGIHQQGPDGFRRGCDLEFVREMNWGAARSHFLRPFDYFEHFRTYRSPSCGIELLRMYSKGELVVTISRSARFRRGSSAGIAALFDIVDIFCSLSGFALVGTRCRSFSKLSSQRQD